MKGPEVVLFLRSQRVLVSQVQSAGSTEVNHCTIHVQFFKIVSNQLFTLAFSAITSSALVGIAGQTIGLGQGIMLRDALIK
jgi:hypothetical protein